MRERVATVGLAEQRDQQHRHAAATEQDAANMSGGPQSERGEQIAQAQSDES